MAEEFRQEYQVREAKTYWLPEEGTEAGGQGPEARGQRPEAGVQGPEASEEEE